MGIFGATLQAAVLSATSNVLAQALNAYQENRPIFLDVAPVLHFILFALLNTPPNFLWQAFLEDTFPGYTEVGSSPLNNKIEQQSSARSLPIAASRKRRQLNVRNTAIKFGLDQTIGALLNTVAFIATMTTLKGAGTQEIVSRVWKEAWPLMKAGYQLWPLVSLLSFTVIPVQQRIVFGSLVGVGWGIFLSLSTNH